jgi:hypothetical protein
MTTGPGPTAADADAVEPETTEVEDPEPDGPQPEDGPEGMDLDTYSPDGSPDVFEG